MNSSAQASGAKTPRSGTQSSWGLLLALVLSALPPIILTLDTEGEKSRQLADIRQEWLEQFEIQATRLEKETEPAFWAETTARRLKRRVYAFGRKIENSSFLAQSLGEAAMKERPRGGPRCRIWATAMGVNEPPGPVQLCRHPNLEKDLPSFFGNLIRELGRKNAVPEPGSQGAVAGSGEIFGRNPWINRLKTTFGEGISGELFGSGGRGKAFHVIFQGKCHLLVWDLLFRKGRAVGGFILLFPVRQEMARDALNYCLANWERGPMYPAFIPAPVGEEKRPPPIILHKVLRTREIIRKLKFVQSKFQGLKLTGAVESEGFVRLHSPLVGNIIPLNGAEALWAYLAPVNPLSGHLGLLVARKPKVPQLLIEQVAILTGSLWLLFWSGILARRTIFGTLPAIPLRTELIFWFCGVLAIPLAFSAGAEVRLIEDVKSNTIFSLKRDLIASLQRIESGSKVYWEKFSGLMKQELGTPDFLQTLLKVQKREVSREEFSRSMLHRFSGKGFTPTGFLIMGHKNFQMRKFPPEFPPQMVDAIAYTGKRIWNRILAVTKIPDEIRDLPLEKEQVNPNVEMFGEKALKFRSLNWSNDGLEPFAVGNKRYLMAKKYLYFGRNIAYSIYLILDQTPLFEPYLKQAFGTDGSDTGESDRFLTAFKIQPNQVTEIGEGKNGRPNYSDLFNAAWRARSNPVWEIDFPRNRLVHAYASQYFPGFILAGQSSLSLVRERMEHESGRILAFLFLSAVLLAGAGYVLAIRLSEPLMEMIRVLRGISTGDLDGFVNQARGDELGRTGMILNTMTRWLQERKKMSRFVAPQVLDVISDGDYDSAMRGTEKQVAILVSDVRSFTTLTETHPPSDIFSLINHHMEIMTPAIQKNGGIIDRFIGDAIQAVFYPGPGNNPPFQAIRAAIAMRKLHTEINRTRVKTGAFPYEIGIGVEVGTVVAGVMGDRETRLDYSVLGEPLQKAAELEAMTKFGKTTRIAVSEEVLKATGPVFQFHSIPDTGHAFELESLEEIGSQVIPSQLPTPPVLRCETSTGAPVSQLNEGGSTLPGRHPLLLSLLGLWLLPAFIVFWSISSFVSRVENLSLEKEKGALFTTLHRLQGTTDLHYQAETFLRNELLSLEGFLKSPDTPETRKKIEALFQRLSTLFPKVCLFLFDHVASESPELFSRTWDATTRLRMAWGEEFGPVVASEAKAMFTIWKMYLFLEKIPFPHLFEEHLTRSTLDWLKFNLRPRLGWNNSVDITRVICQSLDHFVSIKAAREQQMIFWKPFFQDPFWRLKGKEISPSLLGGVLLFLSQDSLDEKNFWRFLFENLKREGFEVLVRPRNQNSEAGFKTPRLFGTWTPSENPNPTASEIQVSGNWLISHDSVTLDTEMDIFLARQWRGNDSRINRLNLFLGAFLFFWGLTGVWLFRDLRRSWFTSPLSLKWQLLGVLLLVVMPTLSLGSFVLEESMLEKFSRVTYTMENNLQQECQAYDKGSRMFNAFASRVVEEQTEVPPVTKAPGPDQGNNVDAKAVASDPLLGPLFTAAVTLGLQFKAFAYYGLDGSARGFKFEKRMLEYNRAIIGRTLNLLNPGQERTSSEKLSSRELFGEEMKKILQSFLPPDQFAAWLSAPRVLISTLTPGAREQVMYSRHVRLKGASKWIFQAYWESKATILHLAREWHNATQKLHDRPISPGMVHINRESWKLVSPFWTLSLEEPSDHASSSASDLVGRMDEMIEVNRPEIAHLCSTAKITGKCETAEGTISQRPVYLLAYPGQYLKTMILYNSIFLDEFYGPIREAFLKKRFFLGGLLLLCILLAFWVARQFLSPLNALADAAKEIMRRNFAVRLPLTRNNEFGELAVAFNSMAKGVQEGKLLVRFVSEAVQEAVKDRHDELISGNGTSIEAVIMFAGLGEFKPLLKSENPVRLIGNLNLFLEKMSGIIRNHHGSIDKFIGEKILAVFHPDKCGGPHAAAAAAVRCAREMRQAMAEIGPWKSHPLGIGITSGKALSGILGTKEVRLEFTVLGDPVNLAARLCDLSLQSGGGCLIEENTMKSLQKENEPLGSGATSMGDLSVKGKTQKIKTYKL